MIIPVGEELKKKEISGILNDFFEEILKEIDLSITNYKKSNDEKYLTEIKNITGKSINDEQLLKLALKEKDVFLSEMNDLFTQKKNYRVKILGEEQNKSLEKKYKKPSIQKVSIQD